MKKACTLGDVEAKIAQESKKLADAWKDLPLAEHYQLEMNGLLALSHPADTDQRKDLLLTPFQQLVVQTAHQDLRKDLFEVGIQSREMPLSMQLTTMGIDSRKQYAACMKPWFQ